MTSYSQLYKTPPSTSGGAVSNTSNAGVQATNSNITPSVGAAGGMKRQHSFTKYGSQIAGTNQQQPPTNSGGGVIHSQPYPSAYGPPGTGGYGGMPPPGTGGYGQPPPGSGYGGYYAPSPASGPYNPYQPPLGHYGPPPSMSGPGGFLPSSPYGGPYHSSPYISPTGSYPNSTNGSPMANPYMHGAIPPQSQQQMQMQQQPREMLLNQLQPKPTVHTMNPQSQQQQQQSVQSKSSSDSPAARSNNAVQGGGARARGRTQSSHSVGPSSPSMRSLHQREGAQTASASPPRGPEEEVRSTRVKVVARVRPMLPHEQQKGQGECVACPVSSGGQRNLVLTLPVQPTVGATPSQQPRTLTSPKPSQPSPPETIETSSRTFEFDAVLGPDAQQRHIFDRSGVKEYIDAALTGYAATVFAYGQTGSGKTFTMTGEPGAEKEGLIPRSIQYLFQHLEENSQRIARMRPQGQNGEGPEGSWSVRAEVLEIYNEQVRDLLNPESGSLSIRQQLDGTFFCHGCLSVDCRSLEDVSAVLEEARKNRVVRAHALNQDSSRSHAIFILQVDREIVLPPSADLGNLDQQQQQQPSGPEFVMRYGKLCFVDLAGSENLKQSKSSGVEAIKETASINKSLFTLGAVISLLSDMAKGRRATTSHVPFRNSILTKLLQDSIGGRGMAMMLACVSPSQMHCQETLRTLMYADRARNIKTKPTLNNTISNANKDEIIFQLRRDIRTLTLENSGLRNLLLQHNIPIPDAETLQGPLSSAGGGRRGGGGGAGGGKDGLITETSEWMRLNSRGGTAFKSRASLVSPGTSGANNNAGAGVNGPPVTATGNIDLSDVAPEVIKHIRKLEKHEKATEERLVAMKKKLEVQEKQLVESRSTIESHERRVEQIVSQVQTQSQQQIQQVQAQSQAHVAQVRAEAQAQVEERVKEKLAEESLERSFGSGGRKGAGGRGGGGIGGAHHSSLSNSGSGSGGEDGVFGDPMHEDSHHTSLGLNAPPAQLHAANLALIHANRELRRMVRLLETGPDNGRDLSDDYEAMSPNRKKHVSENFALKKSNIRLSKQVTILQEQARHMESEEKKYELEIERLKSALHAATTVPAIPTQLPAVESQQTQGPMPQPPHSPLMSSQPPSLSEYHGDKFGYGSIHSQSKLPGGARPTLSLAIPPPGRSPQAIKPRGGLNEGVGPSQLATSSSASISGSYTSTSATSTMSAQTNTNSYGIGSQQRVAPGVSTQPTGAGFVHTPDQSAAGKKSGAGSKASTKNASTKDTQAPSARGSNKQPLSGRQARTDASHSTEPGPAVKSDNVKTSSGKQRHRSMDTDETIATALDPVGSAIQSQPATGKSVSSSRPKKTSNATRTQPSTETTQEQESKTCEPQTQHELEPETAPEETQQDQEPAQEDISQVPESELQPEAELPTDDASVEPEPTDEIPADSDPTMDDATGLNDPTMELGGEEVDTDPEPDGAQLDSAAGEENDEAADDMENLLNGDADDGGIQDDQADVQAQIDADNAEIEAVSGSFEDIRMDRMDEVEGYHGDPEPITHEQMVEQLEQVEQEQTVQDGVDPDDEVDEHAHKEAETAAVEEGEQI